MPSPKQQRSDPPYEELFEAAPQALGLLRLVLDESEEPCDLQVVAANELFRQVFSLPDVVGRRLSEIDPNYREHAPDIFGIVTRVARTKQTEAHEVYHPRAEKWFELQVFVGLGDLIVAQVDDITGRRQAEAAVRRLQYSLDRLDDYPAWTDEAGHLIEVSESACRHLEYTRDELLNMTVFDICPDIDMQSWENSWPQDSPPAPFRLEAHHKAKSGRMYPVELTVNPMSFDGVRYHCTFCRDISDRRQAETALKRLQYTIDNMDDYPTWIDSAGRIIEVSDSTCRHLEYSREELLAMHVADIAPAVDAEVWAQRWQEAVTKVSFRREDYHRTKSGRVYPVEITINHMVFDGQEYDCVFCRDISDRKRLEKTQSETLKALKEREEQLLHAQKMEAVGRLAGGIAHDFNNVLTTIVGYSDLLLASEECTGRVAEDVGEIKAAAERAAGLTRRILAFSRRQPMQLAIHSLGAIVSDTERLLARTIGADIELRTSLSPDLGRVEVDEHQFVQVLLNLAVNARDAMPDGGALTLETANIDLGEDFCRTHPEAHPGPHVLLTVTDTGSGIDADVLAHVFEPFYTTKPPGQGTGLGLATVYGLVSQSGGCVYVQSRPGEGTTFTIYLPRVEAEAQTVMVVDSDATFLSLASRILSRQGFRSLALQNGERAADMLADLSIRVDLLLTDLSLSGGLQGEHLASIAATRRPGLPVLFMSDQDRDPVVDAGRAQGQKDHLEKPFTAEELTQRVRTCLSECDPIDRGDHSV